MDIHGVSGFSDEKEAAANLSDNVVSVMQQGASAGTLTANPFSDR